MNARPLPDLDDAAIASRQLPSRKTWWRRAVWSRFLLISILVHVLLGLGAAVFVVQRYTATRKLTFKGGPPSPNRSTREVEHKVQMAKKQSTASAPTMAKRITTTGIAKVTLPEMPAMPALASAPSKMAGAGTVSAPASMGAIGASQSGVGGSAVSMFGLRDPHGGSLRGTFYDLKQTPAKGATGMTPEKYGDAILNFVKGGWNEGTLAIYYKSATSLYASQFMIPDIDANEGPKAFQVEKEVQPSMFAALYKGEVTAPESGTFYFVGAGDDVLMVRFNQRTVLNASWYLHDSLPSVKAAAQYNYGWTLQPGGLTKGEAFEVEKGKTYPIEILIGEQGGGKSHAVLLLEQGGFSYTKDSSGNPILPAFRMGDSKPPPLKPEETLPPHLDTGLIWPGTSVKKATSGLDALHKPQ